MQPLSYLAGYPPELLAQALPLLKRGGVAEYMVRRHGPPHTVRTDGALYDYAADLKNRFLRNAGPIAKVAYDPRLQRVQQALGTHTRVSRVQGSRLQARREIRVASLFRHAPEPFLRMIVVHELAHLKHAAHDKAFYALCCHMQPQYHAVEFDVRLWLCALDAAMPDTKAGKEAASMLQPHTPT
jgi:UTP pyrophosphatase